MSLWGRRNSSLSREERFFAVSSVGRWGERLTVLPALLENFGPGGEGCGTAAPPYMYAPHAKPTPKLDHNPQTTYVGRDANYAHANITFKLLRKEYMFKCQIVLNLPWLYLYNCASDHYDCLR